jgi:basic membrane protein A
MEEGQTMQRGRARMWPRWLAVVATLLITGLVTAGCGSDDDDSGGGSSSKSSKAPISKFAIVAPEKGNDYGYNQQGVDAAKKIASDRGIDLEVADGSGYEDIAPILRELATSGGAEFVIAQASGYNTIAPDVAEQTGVPMIVWDNPEANTPGVTANVSTESQEGAYLAGVLAAKTTKSGKLGIVISADDTNWNKMSGGFVAGARSVDPKVKIQLAQIGQAGYADAAGGRRVTETLIANGADVIFGMGDGSSFGMLEAVERADGVQFIDVIGDKTPIDDKHVLLSSVYWDLSGIYNDAIDDIGNKSFGKKDYVIDLANNGVSLLKTDQIDAKTWKEIQATRKEIIDGKIDIPLTEKKAQVEDLIAQG